MNEIMNSSKTALNAYQESRELSEIKGKMVLARQFPRDENLALERVLNECSRPALASMAQYEFPRGDSVVKGASIRLVEVLARYWGHINCGVNDIENGNGYTTVKAFAWDLENNVSDEKIFTVRHERTAGRGNNRKTYALTDSRDIYEMVANQAARRKRACILSLLPGWYVEAAMEKCDETLRESLTKDKTIEQVREDIVAAFAEFEITPQQIEEKLSKSIDKLSKNDVVKLRHLYSAIKDGFVKAKDAFGIQQDSTVPGLITEEEEDALNSLNLSLFGGAENAGSDEG